MKWTRPGALVLAVVAVAAGVGSAAQGAASSSDATTRVAATLNVRAALKTASSTASRRFGENCAPGTPALVECFDVRGSGTIRGLGRVSLSSLHFVDTAPQGCPSGEFRVIGASMRISVAGKGRIDLRLDPAEGCRTLATVLSHTRSYSVADGTGKYAGATGAGTVRREAGFGGSGATGNDLVVGTLTVPGLEFDLTPPRLSGASSRSFKAANGATRTRVAYQVTARDAVDGRVVVKCTPPSGSRFRIGRTVVTCSGTDSSGNTARVRFTVSVTKGGG
jgi:hypothetical protein